MFISAKNWCMFPLVLLIGIFMPIHAVKFQVIDKTGYITGCNRFKTEIGQFYAKQLMGAASSNIWQVFNQNTTERKDYDRVMLIVGSFGHLPNLIVASTAGNTIRINANYIQNYLGDARVEFTGIVMHEMTHVWQNHGNDKAPRGLINGIADYMRLRLGWAPKEWAQAGEGSHWDEGFAVTAYFLDYCNSLKEDFVADLNRLMKDDYNEKFFAALLGKPVEELWMDYKSKYELPLSQIS